VIYHYVPIAVSMKLMEEREGTKDQHESDPDYQDCVIEVYKELTLKRAGWHLIECAPRGVLLTREAIHEKIWRIVEPLI